VWATRDWLICSPWYERASRPELIFSEVKHDVSADVYIDDSPTVLSGLIAKGLKVVIFDQPWNQDVYTHGARGQRAFGWDHAVRAAQELALWELNPEKTTEDVA
jgi:5'(3')-deoxyribonucleotidase